MMNDINDDFWFKHFSADEFYILQTNIAYLVVYCLLIFGCLYTGYELRARSYLHATYKLFVMSVFAQTASLVCAVSYYALYASSGMGTPQLKFLAFLFSTSNTVMLLLLSLLLAKGLTVTRGRLKSKVTAKVAIFVSIYSTLHSFLYIYEQHYFDPGEVLYLYESPAGYGIAGLRIIGWGWFVYATVFTLLHYPEKVFFYTRFFLLYTLWYLSLPVVILMASKLLPKWCREISVNFMENIVTLLVHATFLVIMRPSKANALFPFHVRTTQVDVTIDPHVPSYTERFPHHAYEPTVLLKNNNNNNQDLMNNNEVSTTGENDAEHEYQLPPDSRELQPVYQVLDVSRLSYGLWETKKPKTMLPDVAS